MSILSCWRDIGIHGDRSCPELIELIHCRNCDRYAQGVRILFERTRSDEAIAETRSSLPCDLPTHFPDSSRTWRSSTEVISQGVTAVETQRNAVAIFRIAQEWFALPASVFQSITVPTPIRPIPMRSNSLFQGLVNVRGELLLCVDLRSLLHGVEKATPETTPRLAIVQDETQRWAFLVDEFQGIESVPLSSLFAPPLTLLKAVETYTQKLFTWQNRTISYLDESLLFEALNRKVIA